MFKPISLEKIKAFFQENKKNPSTLAGEECEKNLTRNQHALFLSWGWMHDCLQTTAEREYVSRGNLITQRQSHGASCCEWVHSGREKTLAWLQFGSSSIPCNLHEHAVLLQFMTPLSVIFLKSISALNMISLRLTVIIENRVIDTVM